jgi:hypothetical protein
MRIIIFLDSLTSVAVVSSLEKELNIQIPIELILSRRPLRDVVQHIQNSLGSKSGVVESINDMDWKKEVNSLWEKFCSDTSFSTLKFVSAPSSTSSSSSRPLHILVTGATGVYQIDFRFFLTFRLFWVPFSTTASKRQPWYSLFISSSPS